MILFYESFMSTVGVIFSCTAQEASFQSKFHPLLSAVCRDFILRNEKCIRLHKRADLSLITSAPQQDQPFAVGSTLLSPRSTAKNWTVSFDVQQNFMPIPKKNKTWAFCYEVWKLKVSNTEVSFFETVWFIPVARKLCVISVVSL